MPKNDTIRTMLQQEQDLELWRARLLGFPIWSLERIAYYRLVKDGTTSPTGARLGAPERSANDCWLSRSKHAFQALQKVRAAGDIWVLSSSTYRRRTEEGAHPCIFTQELEAQLGSRLLFFETNDASLPDPTGDNVISIDRARQSLHSAARVVYRAASGRLAASQSRVLGLLPQARQRPLLMASLIGRGMYELGVSLMRARKPTAIFVLCAYGKHIPFQLAARKLGIPIIELQHGMIHESHPGYILPTLDPALERSLPFPDHLVVFGSHFGELLDRESPRWRGHWSVGGHAFLQALHQRFQSAPPASTRARPRVVFFSQFENAVQKQIDRTAAAFAGRSASRYTVAIKPHPRERDPVSIYAKAADAGVEILAPTDNSYRILETTDVAISVYSTLAVEALVYPCRSVVLKSRDWSEVIHSLLADGFLESANDAEQLVALLARPPTVRDRRDVARRLFGIGEPGLDFASLIERVSDERRQPNDTGLHPFSQQS